MFIAAPTASAMRATSAAPERPVKALALPEFTSTAKPRPSSAGRVRHSWHHSTGAARVEERVKTPATLLPGATSTSITSLRPA